MSFFTKLERLFGRFAIPNITLYLIIGQVFFWGLAMMIGFDLRNIALFPAAVMVGQIWRVVTFLFVPPSLSTDVFSLISMAFGWYLFFLMGTALEHNWGAFRYNAFLFVGWLLTVASAFIAPLAPASYVYLAGSVFLAFAYLNPDFALMVFFIIPVKIKWLALVQWIGFAYVLIVGPWSDRLAVVAASGNFLLFFAGDIVSQVRTGRRRKAFQAKVAGAREEAESVHRHICRVCGKTNLSDPKMDFRYCSKCAGNQCYCSDHIFNHVHVLVDEEAKRPS
jgi:hypothetical protein